MAKEAGIKKPICPFKKMVERDYNGNTGKTTLNERLAPCAGERCMAYRPDGKCARVDGPTIAFTPTVRKKER